MLLGRDDELAALAGLLAQAQLVTVTGIGGVGKTALALAAAPGATVCELAGTTRSDEVGAAVAAALGYPSLAAALVGLAGTEAVVVLDNCEHVLDAAADVADALLKGCASVTVLATSRERLDLPEERVLPLQPLPVPDCDEPARLSDSPAVALLLARARDAGVDLLVDAENAEPIAALSRRLDGLPLAIELAAARTPSLTPAEILEHLNDRHDLLARRRSRGPGRHRSLDTAIGWSYSRLPDTTGVFFDRLGVFAGRFTAEEATAVAGEPGADLLAAIGHLDHLVSASMVTVRHHAGRSWYGLLDTLRAFARARLDERGDLVAVQDRWIDHLAGLAARIQWGVVLPGGIDIWHQTSAAQADVLAAVRYCLERDRRPDRAARLARQLGPIVYNARAQPLVELGERLLARWPDRRSPEWAEFAAVTAFAQMAMRTTDRATELAGDVLGAAPSPFAAVLCLRTLYLNDLLADRPAAALRWVDQGITVAEAGGEPGWVSELRTLRAGALAALGREDEAAVEADRAQAQARVLGSVVLQVWAALTQASLLALRNRSSGRAALAELRERCRTIGFPLVDGAACWGLAGIALIEDRPAEAARWLQGALEVFVRIGGPPLLVTLRWAAASARLAGDGDTAALLHRAAGPAGTTLTLAILERAWLGRLLGSLPADGDPPPLREAVALARWVLAELAAVPGPAAAEPATGTARFVRDGGIWTLAYAGRTARLPDAKGLHDLATLLARPGREVHCTELVGAAVDQPDTGPVLDAQARRRYESRIVELQADLAEAEDLGDRGRADTARLELDLLVDELAAASGLGGRTRRTGGTAERARTAVSWRVRAALRRIDEVHPALAAHLRGAVRIGAWSIYRPDEATSWELTAGSVPPRGAASG